MNADAQLRTPMLDRVDSPSDLRGLDAAELTMLAAEIRDFLIQKVALTGGHLGPNLGVVELTLALHRVFDSPSDALIFDTGHQSYVHKIVTGRRDGFDTLRRRGGLSGYPSRRESEHDWIESSHASASLSYADGLAKAFALTGRPDRSVVAIIGDGALTGGMSWEALNNIAANKDRSVIVVVNDNGRSYAPTIGGLAHKLSTLRVQPSYNRVLALLKSSLPRVPLVGPWAYRLIHAAKMGLKDALAPQSLFSDLDIKYLGPIDGHDIAMVETALARAKTFGGPVLVHAVTQKGKGYRPAERDTADNMHGPGPFDPSTGKPVAAASTGQSWTSVFSAELLRHAEEHDRIVAITAAMPGPTGLSAFAERFPDRVFDVGIAEQHAVTSAAGMALGGLHPVVAIYSTFLNRAFDQMLMDVALLRLPVTFVLDRAGITGSDGASHNGMWDLSILAMTPGMRVAAPRDADSLRELLADALTFDGGPTAIRYPKGSAAQSIPAVDRIDDLDLLYGGPAPSGACAVLIVSVGSCASMAVAAARLLDEHAIAACVIDPRWVLPVSEAIAKLAHGFHLVVTIEDGGLHGGVGSAISAGLHTFDVTTPSRNIGVPQEFLEHATRDEVHHEIGLTAPSIARRITDWLDATGAARARGQQPAV